MVKIPFVKYLVKDILFDEGELSSALDMWLSPVHNIFRA